MPYPYKGSCLCGKVRFEINGPINDIVYCHCSLCRKAQGSAFATNGNVVASTFRFNCGESELTAYEAAPGHHKYFCKHCGSPVMSTNDKAPDMVRIRLGTIESDIDERPAAHIYATSKANWETIEGDLPQYQAYVPDDEH